MKPIPIGIFYTYTYMCILKRSTNTKLVLCKFLKLSPSIDTLWMGSISTFFSFLKLKKY